MTSSSTGSSLSENGREKAAPFMERLPYFTLFWTKRDILINLMKSRLGLKMKLDFTHSEGRFPQPDKGFTFLLPI